MKLNFNSFLRIFLVLCIAFTVSCKKDDETPGNTNNNKREDTTEEPKIEETKFAEGGSVKKEKAPRSEKVSGDTTVNGQTVTSPSNLANDDDAQEKLNILTGGGSSTQRLAITNEDLSGWFIDAVNGQETFDDQFVIFFELDGTYIIYDFEFDDWFWGYYYVDKSVSYLVLDPGTQWTEYWSVSTLTSDLMIMNDGVDEFKLGKYSLGIEEEPYTQQEAAPLIQDKVWYMYRTYGNGTSDDFLAEKSWIQFNSNGSVTEKKTKYNQELDSFEEVDNSAEGASWEIDKDGYFIYSDYQKSMKFELSYILENEFIAINTDFETIDSEEPIDIWFLAEEDYLEVFGDVNFEYAKNLALNGGDVSEPVLYDENNNIYFNSLSDMYYSESANYLYDAGNTMYYYLDFVNYVYYDPIDKTLYQPIDYLILDSDVSPFEYRNQYDDNYVYVYDAASGKYNDSVNWLQFDGTNISMLPPPEL